MKNKFRSKVFRKINDNIQQSTTSDQLTCCRKMIENATPILDKDELDVIKGYLLDAWDKINPVGESFADEIDLRNKALHN